MFKAEILSVRAIYITQANGDRKYIYKAYFALPNGDVCYLNTDKLCEPGDYCLLSLRLDRENRIQAFIADIEKICDKS